MTIKQLEEALAKARKQGFADDQEVYVAMAVNPEYATDLESYVTDAVIQTVEGQRSNVFVLWIGARADSPTIISEEMIK